MNIKKIIFFVLLVAIIISAIVQQYKFAEFSFIFFGRDNSLVPKTFVENEGKIVAVVDLIELESDFLFVSGWATLENIPSKYQHVYVCLKREHDSLLISATPDLRLDVGSYLQSESYNYCGYRMILPACKIENGTYQIGLMIEARGVTQGKWTDKFVEIKNQPISNGQCDSLYQMKIGDYISMQRYKYDKLKSYLGHTAKVSYVRDTLPYPSNEIRALEASYSLAPVIVERGIKHDTIVGYFPLTKTILNQDNLLYSARDQYEVLKDFGFGLMILRKIQQPVE